MKENTRQKLIDATFEEIYSHGYQGASLSKILNTAGILKGSMYHFFKNKKEMALSAINEKMDERFQNSMEIFELKEGVMELFIALLKDTSTKDFKRGCPIANLIQEMSNIDEDFHKTMKHIFENFKGYFKMVLDKAVEIHELKECDTTKLALYIAAVIEGAVLAAKASGEQKDYLDTIEVLETYLLSLKK